MFCPQCGAHFEGTANYCTACGYKVSGATGVTPVDKPINPTLSTDDKYKALIGPNRQGYYLRRFAHFNKRGKIGVSWNWPAFFVGFWWLLYRKMWLNALLYFLLPYVLMLALGIISVLVRWTSDAFVIAWYAVYLPLIFVVFPMYANALYYMHCRRKIHTAQVRGTSPQQQLLDLARDGGTSNGAVFVLLAFALVAIVGILAAIAIPQYQAYVTRSEFSEGLEVAQRAETAVNSTYQRLGYIPASNNLADPNSFGLPAANRLTGPDVSSVTVSAPAANGDATITIQYKNEATADTPSNAVLVLTARESSGTVVWVCGYAVTSVGNVLVGSSSGNGTNVPMKYLPSDCR